MWPATTSPTSNDVWILFREIIFVNGYIINVECINISGVKTYINYIWVINAILKYFLVSFIYESIRKYFSWLLKYNIHIICIFMHVYLMCMMPQYLYCESISDILILIKLCTVEIYVFYDHLYTFIQDVDSFDVYLSGFYSSEYYWHKW